MLDEFFENEINCYNELPKMSKELTNLIWISESFNSLVILRKTKKGNNFAFCYTSTHKPEKQKESDRNMTDCQKETRLIIQINLISHKF